MAYRRVWVLIACLVLAGCSAGVPGQTSDSGSPQIVVTPTVGHSLADMGFSHDPATQLWLPDGTQVNYKADQPNTLIVTGPISQATTVQDYLVSTLPGLGWQITAQDDGALLFNHEQWQGAFAAGTKEWALTVRDD